MLGINGNELGNEQDPLGWNTFHSIELKHIFIINSYSFSNTNLNVIICVY